MESNQKTSFTHLVDNRFFSRELEVKIVDQRQTFVPHFASEPLRDVRFSKVNLLNHGDFCYPRRQDFQENDASLTSTNKINRRTRRDEVGCHDWCVSEDVHRLPILGVD